MLGGGNGVSTSALRTSRYKRTTLVTAQVTCNVVCCYKTEVLSIEGSALEDVINVLSHRGAHYEGKQAE